VILNILECVSPISHKYNFVEFALPTKPHFYFSTAIKKISLLARARKWHQIINLFIFLKSLFRRKNSHESDDPLVCVSVCCGCVVFVSQLNGHLLWLFTDFFSINLPTILAPPFLLFLAIKRVNKLNCTIG
jgi:hypothetical protein